jgi:hypothetical protein
VVQWVLGLDGLVARSRPAWWWVGQWAVVLLGVHLAADRLDDGITAMLAGSSIPWPEPEQPITLGIWSAVLLELYVAGWAIVTWLRASEEPARSAQEWASRATLHAIAAPVFWATTMLAGAWVVGMATEDMVARLWEGGAQASGWMAALLALWRVGWPGLRRVVLGTPTPLHRWDGALTIWPGLVVAGLALRYGLPIWGWLP